MSPRTLDFYAVLQVAPDAEREVVEAAYRQLMRKYHPDVGRGDEQLAQQLHERAKAINQAYSVLRDPSQRQAYDRMRQREHWSAVPPPPRPSVAASWPPNGRVATVPSAAPASYQVLDQVEPRPWWIAEAPLNLLASAYYLLPGPYEWEAASRREAFFTSLIPPLGVLSWLAVTGGLAPVLGRSPYAVLTVWVISLLVLAIVDWRSLPRLAMAGGPTLALMSGTLDAAIASAGIPIWLVWVGLSGMCMLLVARTTVFGILPTLAACWLLSHVR